MSTSQALEETRQKMREMLSVHAENKEVYADVATGLIVFRSDFDSTRRRFTIATPKSWQSGRLESGKGYQFKSIEQQKGRILLHLVGTGNCEKTESFPLKGNPYPKVKAQIMPVMVLA